MPNFSSTFLGKSYSKGTFDLKDLDLHNIGIEHDASLTRTFLYQFCPSRAILIHTYEGEDVALVPDQSHPSLDLVEGLLATASGKNKEGEVILTPADLSYYSAKRRVDARRTNPEYQLDFGHKMFGSSKYVVPFVPFDATLIYTRTFSRTQLVDDAHNFWRTHIRPQTVANRGALAGGVGAACPQALWSDDGYIQPNGATRRVWYQGEENSAGGGGAGHHEG